MFELSPVAITAIMFGAIFLGIFLGYPLAIPIGAVTLAMGFLIFGDSVVELIVQRVFLLFTSYVLAAAPSFIFMGVMLERSGVANRLYEALYLWLGGFRGGLAIVTVLVGTIVAATVGVVAASVTMLTLLALTPMIQRGYSKSLASGAICAGGTLGILIPPSIMLVVYGPMAGISVGKLFMAAFIPGFILSGLYCSYIAIRCLLQPKIAPSVPAEDRAVPFMKKTTMLLTSFFPLAILIMSVLGVIFLGIAPPTEAAAIGAVAATLLTIAYKRFSWGLLKEAATQTMKIVSFVLLIGGMSYAFVAVFLAGGGGKVVEELILAVPGGRWGSFAIVMFIFFILGFFIDWIGILFIMVPIISPLAPSLGFDPLWFAMMICVNLQMSFMTPPMAVAIFYLRGAADPKLGVKIDDIIRGIIPFSIIIMITLGLCVAFPQIILWLPAQMIK
jgi:tripartite ATP-independent transporter DctM subunit